MDEDGGSHVVRGGYCGGDRDTRLATPIGLPAAVVAGGLALPDDVGRGELEARILPGPRDAVLRSHRRNRVLVALDAAAEERPADRGGGGRRLFRRAARGIRAPGDGRVVL